jgi:hypothetical protein
MVMYIRFYKYELSGYLAKIFPNFSKNNNISYNICVYSIMDGVDSNTTISSGFLYYFLINVKRN